MTTELEVALVPTVTVIISGLINWFQGRQIHTLVNSRMTEVKADLKTAVERLELSDKRVEALEKILSTLRQK